MMRPSSSEIYRPVVLSRLSLAIQIGLGLFPSQQTPQQLLQVLMMRQSIYGTSRLESAIIQFSSRTLYTMLYSHSETLNTSYLYLMTRSGNGMPKAVRSGLHLMASMLLAPQMVLSLFHASKTLLQFTIPVLVQLLLSSRQDRKSVV